MKETNNFIEFLKIIWQIFSIFLVSFLIVMGFVFICLLIANFVRESILNEECGEEKIYVEGFCKSE